MHFSTSIVLLVLSASVAFAAPLTHEKKQSPAQGKNDTLNPGYGSSGQGQQPFQFPLPNGFPEPSAPAVVTIEQAAGGTLSDAPPPGNPGPDGLTNLQLIAFNEIFEVAYFTDLIFNITNNVPGYTNIGDRDYILEALVAVQAQEELHALNANGALTAFGLPPIQPCEYIFPVEDFQSAIALAGTFTDLVLGTLQDVQEIFANANAGGLVRSVGSVIGQEGEQEGYYRFLQGKRPSSSAFLTTSVRDFAFTALQSFVVPGSCPNENEIKLKIFGALNVLNAKQLSAKNGIAQFSVDTRQGAIDSSSSIVYISGQNLPVTVPITNLAGFGTIATFEASFPFQGGEGGVGAFSDGLTIAAVVPGNTQFATADQVAQVATFGPGLIEID